MADKEIKINVNDNPLQRLRQQAEGLARSMIKSARQSETDAGKVIRDINEQIQLLEKRKKISEEFAKTEIAAARAAGAITPKQAQQRLQTVSAVADENKLLIGLVREIIGTIKETSKSEIRENKKDVEKTLRHSQVTKLDPRGDEFQNLKQTFQAQQLQQPSQSQNQITQWMKRNRIRERTERTLNKVAGAQNEYTFLTSMLEGLPWAGPALATAGERAITNATNFEQAAIEFGRLHRFNGAEGALKRGRIAGHELGTTASYLGMTPGEALRRQTGFERNLQRGVGGREFLNLLGANRVLGLDQSTIQQLLATARYDRSTADPTQVLAQFDQYLRRSEKALSILPELVGTFNQASNQILQTRGEVDTVNLSRVISNIARQTGFEGQRLNRLTGAFGQLGRTANPVTRALLMQSFRETDPNLSFVDIQERLEGGLDEKSRPGLQRFFEIMRERTGGGDALTLALQTALPQLSIKDIRDVIKSGGFAKALQLQQIAPPTDIGQRISEFVGPIEQSGKQIAGFLELSGDKLVQVIDRLTKKIQSVIDKPIKEEENGAEEITKRTTNQLQDSPLR